MSPTFHTIQRPPRGPSLRTNGKQKTESSRPGNIRATFAVSPLLVLVLCYLGSWWPYGSLARADSALNPAVSPIEDETRETNPEDPPTRFSEGLPLAADTTDIQTQIGDTTMTLSLDGHALVVPYFSNGRLLTHSYPQITRAVVVIHGTLRNANDYLHSIEAAAEGVPAADSTAFLLAPQFLTEADVRADTLADNYLFWAYMGWRQGDRSLNTVEHPRPAGISSFAVIDTVLLRLAQLQPGLQQIVVAGHSAGGQFTNRYVAGNRIQQVLNDNYGIQVSYIVANPSSYLYLDDRRWVPGSDNLYAVPSPEQLQDCPTYDLYKYGLNAPNEYMNIGSEILRSQFGSRDVAYLLGQDDIDPNHHYLERNCEAMMQGEFRLQRGLLYRPYLVSVFGNNILTRHHFAVVPNAAHDNTRIFTSSCGIYYLFSYGSCGANLPNPPWQDRTTVALRVVAGRSASWGDYNGDSRPDLFVSASDSTDRLFRNDPGSTLTECAVTDLGDPQTGMSASWADVDGDGRQDLYNTNWRGQNRLFHNDGNDSFHNIAEGPLAASGDLSESDWADYDRDGDLDVFLVRSSGQGNTLLRNDGESGFTDVTSPLMADSASTRDATWVDYDNDGDEDLYLVRNDHACLLLRNDGGTFVDATVPPLDEPRGAFAACWGDYDNDGDLDLFLVKRGSACKLLRNDGASGFTDVTTAPLNFAGMTRSASWGDYDNDGDLDLYLAVTGGQNRLFRNDGGGAFTDVSAYPLNDMGVTWCAAWADYDGDGLLDLYVADDTNWNKLFRNKGTSPPNHWLEVDLRGVQSNTFGVGARVRVVAGGRTQIREVGTDGGALAQNSLTAHFGLGTAAVVDTLQVIWPSGIVQTEIPGLPVNWRIQITESELPASLPAPIAGTVRLSGPIPNPFAQSVSLTLSSPAPGSVKVQVFDLSGRLVRTLLDDGRRLPNLMTLKWDGKDQSGRETASGLYFARIVSGNHREERMLVKIR